MSKMKLALSIAEDLRKLAGNIETFIKSVQSEDDNPKAVPPQTKPIPIEKVRAVLAEKSQSGKQSAVKGLIIKYGANKLTDIENQM